MIDTVIAGLTPRYVPYEAGLRLQRETHREVASGALAARLLLLEHEAVYTAGTRTAREEWPSDGAPVVPTDRGGKLTWHGPGQLVGYPILRLPDPVDVVAYVRRLEDLLVATIREFDVPATRVRGRSGVWIERPDHPPRADGRPWCDKIAAIGIRVARAVTMHGFALNCSNSLTPYENVVACGIRDGGVTTLSREAGREVTPADVVPVVRRLFEDLVLEPARPRRATTAGTGPRQPVGKHSADDHSADDHSADDHRTANHGADSHSAGRHHADDHSADEHSADDHSAEPIGTAS